MALSKRFLKSRPSCKVTFELAPEAARDARRVCLVGDFNDWKVGDTPLSRRKNGTFAATVELPTGRDYQYRYVLDEEVWINDPAADRYVATPYGDGDNCVVSV
jgi:1,4-alpha-glucan branching enzyme